MTPKDKALELYFKYEKELRVYKDNGFYYDGRKTKNACLIAVDEIIESRKDDKNFDDSLFSTSEYYSKHPMYLSYWQEVKKKIEKL